VSDLVVDLAGEVERLHRRVRAWTPPSWRLRARVTAPTITRADRMIALLVELAEFGRAAGSGAPPAATPERLGEHALPDQLVVLANDLIEALSDEPVLSGSVGPVARRPAGPPAATRAKIAARARAAVRAASADLVV
jgi:hypothetical protein